MRSSEAQATKRLAEFDSNCALLAAPVATPLETLRMLMLRARRRSPRSSSYIEHVQRDGMTASWRHKMSHWMFETGSAFEMARDTVACALCLMDQYLSVHSVSKHQLQLLSLVSLSVASKMHETQPISMDEMQVLCENKFPRKALWEMEAQLMVVVDWQLNPPTAFAFARALVAALDPPSHEQELFDAMMGFLQDSAEDYASLRFGALSLAIAAVFVAAKLQRLDISSLLAAVLSSLSTPPPVTELVECFKYLAYLQSVKNPAETTPAASKLMENAGARSPCAVDEDVDQRGGQRCSSDWMIEFRSCVEKGLQSVSNDYFAVDGKDCTHKRKRSEQALRRKGEHQFSREKSMKVR